MTIGIKLKFILHEKKLENVTHNQEITRRKIINECDPKMTEIIEFKEKYF